MPLTFEVRRNSTYMELIIFEDNFTRASSGLLDEQESIDLAKELIYAAEQLLPARTGEIEQALAEARERL